VQPKQNGLGLIVQGVGKQNKLGATLCSGFRERLIPRLARGRFWATGFAHFHLNHLNRVESEPRKHGGSFGGNSFGYGLQAVLNNHRTAN
jgi:hypothetical protein